MKLGTPISTAKVSEMKITCPTALLAPAPFSSPMRRATRAVAAVLRPMAMEYTSVSTDSVRPTVATASVPILATKNTSTMANRASITISRIMGTDSMKMARLMLPDVKFVSVPRNAARNNRMILVI